MASAATANARPVAAGPNCSTTEGFLRCPLVASAPAHSNREDRPMRIRFVIAMACAALASCATERPDFVALYDFKPGAVQPPLIVIPGILSSKLYSTSMQREIWPGSNWNLLFDRKEHLALDIDPETLEPRDDHVEARGLFETALGTDF